MNEAKSTRYHRRRRQAGSLAVVLRAALLVGVAGSGLMPRLVEWSSSVAPVAAWREVLPMTAAVLGLQFGLVSELLSLPSVWYSRFELERRYRDLHGGLGPWLSGYTVSAVVHVAGWVLAAGGAYGLITRWPDVWWAVAGGLFALATLGLTFLGPVTILPRLGRLRRLARPLLRARLDALVEKAGVTVVGCYEWRPGAGPSRSSAALVGFGSTRRVLLSDTLLADYSDDEIEVIVAHELSHHRHGDLWAAVGTEAVSAVAICLAAHAALVAVGPWLGVSDVRDPTGLPLLVLAGGGAAMLIAPLRNALSRQHERRADREAVELTGNPEAFFSGLRRLAAAHLAEERPSRLARWFLYTHPPVADRLAAATAGRAMSPEVAPKGLSGNK